MQDNRIKPILFSTEMVRAILEGRKTVTRRDPFQTPPDYDALKGHYRDSKGRLCAVFQCRKDLTTEAVYARYDRGDILWVRETWSPVLVRPKRYIYKVDAERGIGEGVGLPIKWHPSIHMPKEAARLFLRVAGVRVEQLRDMVLGDVLVEGITEADTYESTWERWHQTWNSTIKPADHERYGWQANPCVWIIQFERCEKPEGWPG